MKILTLILFCLFVSIAQAQVLPGGLSDQNLANYKVDDLTDDQIREIAAKLSEKSMSIDQVEGMAKSKGMSAAEFQKLKSRLASISASEINAGEKSGMDLELKKNENEQTIKVSKSFDKEKNIGISETEIFGQYLFRNPQISFEPNLNIPTPRNYVLAGGDQIDVNIWGASQYNYRFKLSSAGDIMIPYVGVVNLSGHTIESATGKLKAEMAKIYSGLNSASPSTFISVNLSEVRSIKVAIMGQITVPGSYTLPGFATVFNALYAAGGPNNKGSFRSIRLIRNNKTIATVDLYSLLTKGELDANFRLEDQDVIFIDNYIQHITLVGPFRNSGIFEVKKGESLHDLLTICGGFNADAYGEQLTISRKINGQNKILDVQKDFYQSFLLIDGDNVAAGNILSRFENRIEVKGAVYRPGYYELTDSLTLATLIGKCQGFRGDAFSDKLTIYRQRDDLSLEVLSIDAKKGVPAIVLKREDIVFVPSIYDLRQTWHLTIDGEVNKPGKYTYSQNSSIGDLIVQAGGLTDAASLVRIEVARRTIDAQSSSYNETAAHIFTFSMGPNLELSAEAKSFYLEPFDHVVVRRSPAYNDPSSIVIIGEVVFPGAYVLKEKQEYVSDVLARTGGFTPKAYLQGAYIKRSKEQMGESSFEGRLKAHMRRLDKKGAIDEDSAMVLLDEVELLVPLDIDKIMKRPKSEYDLVLMPGDELYVPFRPETVTVSGMVWQPSLIKYDPNAGYKEFLNRAGGFAPMAKRKDSYVVYANGSIKSTRSFLFVRSYPKVEPGSELVVPSKPEKKGASASEVVSLASAISSFALVVVSIVTLTK